jgi:hypothetical protein
MLSISTAISCDKSAEKWSDYCEFPKERWVTAFPWLRGIGETRPICLVFGYRGTERSITRGNARIWIHAGDRLKRTKPSGVVWNRAKSVSLRHDAGE